VQHNQSAPPHSQGANMPDNDTIGAKIPKDTRKVRGTRVRSLRLTASVAPEDAPHAAAAPARENCRPALSLST
jgi:hypothetical protein